MVPDGWEPITEENARYKLRSCMLGAFGVSYPLPDLSPHIHAILREEIASYKRLRPLMKRGKYVALLPQPTSLSAWSAFAYLRNGGQKESATPECGVVLAFRGGQPSPICQRLPIPGLVAEKTYRVLDQDTKVVRLVQGEELMTQGLEISLTEPNSSALIWLFREESAAARTSEECQI